MHLLAHFDTTDYAAWKQAFDRDAEDRALAGLSMLQMWRAVDEPANVTCLFEVADRPRAQGWLDKETGFGAAITAHFLNTA